MKHGDRKQEKETERQLVRLKDRKCLDKEGGKKKRRRKIKQRKVSRKKTQTIRKRPKKGDMNKYETEIQKGTGRNGQRARDREKEERDNQL